MFHDELTANCLLDQRLNRQPIDNRGECLSLFSSIRFRFLVDCYLVVATRPVGNDVTRAFYFHQTAQNLHVIAHMNLWTLEYRAQYFGHHIRPGISLFYTVYLVLAKLKQDIEQANR
jgi:hypothetical protein